MRLSMIPFAFNLSAVKSKFNPITNTIQVFIPSGWEGAWMDYDSSCMIWPKVLSVTGKSGANTFDFKLIDGNTSNGDGNGQAALYISSSGMKLIMS